MKQDPYALEIHNLTKVFYQNRGVFSKKPILALDDISLKIKKGEIFGLVGPNGAGKTTLIKILATLITPTEGSIKINGFDISNAEKIKPMIGLIHHDERSFYPRLSVKQNLEFLAALYGLAPAAVKDRIGQMLELIELQDKADLWVQNLSSGMKQRLAIARGLIHDPDIILMDEPAKGIDPWEVRKFLRFVEKKLHQELGKTLLFITHDIGQIKYISDNVALLHQGKIRAFLNRSQMSELSEQDILDLFEKLMKT